MTRALLLRACLLPVLILGAVGTAGANPSPEVGGNPGEGDSPGSARYGLEPELELLGSVQTMSDEDLDLTYGLLGGGGLGLSVRSGRDTRFVLRVQYLHSKGDPYYDQPGLDAGSPADLLVVPVSMGIRHDLAPNSALRLNAGFTCEIDWIREELPDPASPADDLVHDGVGLGLQFSLGPEYRTRDERYGLGLEIAYGIHGAALSSDGDGNHELNRGGIHGRAYLVFALGARDHSGKVAR